MRIEIEKGDILNSPVNWLYFSIRNIDITMGLTNQLLKLTKESEDNLSGSFLLLKIKLDIAETKFSNTFGKISYLAYVKMPWSLGGSQTVAHLQYKASDENHTMLTLKFDFQTRGIVMGLYFPLIKCRINAFLRKLFKNIEKASLLLEKNDEILSKRLSESQLVRVEEYRKTCCDISVDDSIQNTSRKVQSLEHNLMELGEKVNVLSIELKQAVHHAKTDPNASLTNARTALEKLLISLYRTKMSKEPKKHEIGYILNDNQFTRNIEPRVLARMNSVRHMGNIATHRSGKIMARDANDALDDLSVIIKWYLENIVCQEEDNSPEGRFQEMCKKFYTDGIPGSKERIQIESFRKELGLNIEQGKLLERKVIPAEIRELMGAIDVVYADGMMNENEKEHLYKKAQELGIQKDLATQLIEDYSDVVENSLEERYAAMCRRFYCDSIPSAVQRSEMVNLQQNLGLSDSEAFQIEKNIMPREILELQIMIETIYSDGMMNENEKEHLHQKAESLGVAPELAGQLIQDYCRRMEDTIETKYQSFCNKYYDGTIPTLEQRQQIDQKRIQLGLTEEKAHKIEKSCVPDEIDEYRASVEGVHADGKVDENERAYLNRKAKELGLSEDLAKRVEQEYLSR